MLPALSNSLPRSAAIASTVSYHSILANLLSLLLTYFTFSFPICFSLHPRPPSYPSPLAHLHSSFCATHLRLTSTNAMRNRCNSTTHNHQDGIYLHEIPRAISEVIMFPGKTDHTFNTSTDIYPFFLPHLFFHTFSFRIVLRYFPLEHPFRPPVSQHIPPPSLSIFVQV